MTKMKPEENRGEREAQGGHCLNQIYFYLTRGCNLRCRHCWIAPKFQDQAERYPSLDLELFISVMEQAKPLGLTGVKLTGGEPLIHPKILHLLDYLSAEEIFVEVETNGVKCFDAVARAISACKSPFVSVSLDGVDPETHEWMRGVDGCFHEAIQGIRNLAAHGIRPQIIMTVVRRNMHQIEKMVRMAESLGASSVKFNLVQRIARGESLHKCGEPLAVAEAVALGRRVDMEVATSATIPVYYDYPMAFRPLSRVFGSGGGACGRCNILNILGVLSDGSYAMCGIGETLPELVFGHVEENPLENVWNDNALLRELRDGMPHRLEGICRDCLMKHLCFGSCVAQNFALNKNLWKANWFCEEAMGIGLFPLSRLESMAASRRGWCTPPLEHSISTPI
jgi:SynChlorMet cassette radical SAM/SPASM protein ScmF